MEQIEVEITGQVTTAQYGTLSTGMKLLTNAAFARHLVDDCGAAKYCGAPPEADREPTKAELLAARDALMRREGELNEQAEQLRQQAIDNDAEAGRLAELRAKLDGEAAQLASDKAAFEAAKAAAPAPATGKNKAPAA